MVGSRHHFPTGGTGIVCRFHLGHQSGEIHKSLRSGPLRSDQPLTFGAQHGAHVESEWLNSILKVSGATTHFRHPPQRWETKPPRNEIN